jgi:hypothetical protein
MFLLLLARKSCDDFSRMTTPEKKKSSGLGTLSDWRLTEIVGAVEWVA